MYLILYYIHTGRLLRAFPLKNLEKDLEKNFEKNSNIVKNISEQLRDLIESGEGGPFFFV